MPSFGTTFTLIREGSLFKEIQERAKESKPILKQWGAYLRSIAKAKTQAGQGIAPWAASTVEKYSHSYNSKITANATVRQSYARKLDKALKRKGNEDARIELRRVLSGNTNGKTAWNKTINRLQRNLQRAQSNRANAAQVKSEFAAKAHQAYLANDLANYTKFNAQANSGAKMALGKAKIEKHTLMGKAPGAFKIFLETFRTRVVNMLPYSGALFYGGQVGHGAILPDRSAPLEITAQSRDGLAEIALRWLVKGRQ